MGQDIKGVRPELGDYALVSVKRDEEGVLDVEVWQVRIWCCLVSRDE